MVSENLVSVSNTLRYLLVALPLLVLPAIAPSATAEDGKPPRESVAAAATGVEVPELEAFDRLLPELMQKWEIPGGAVAVAKDGRLVLARGYGLADVEAKEPVRPDSLFRIASISKPITAAAILALVEQGRLRLDDKALQRLGPLEPLEDASPDPRFGRITVRQLLQHTAGFDWKSSFDPMFQPGRIAEAVGVPPPPGPRQIVRYMLGRPLDFDPGTRYVYSNFGYCLLGRIIEQATGKSYEQSVKELVLQPAGITRMRLGHTRLADRAPREVRYYAFAGSKPGESVFPEVREKVAAPYGTFYFEAMDSHGGWIASAIDLVRFATAVDGTRKPGPLKPETIGLIDAEPAPRVSPGQPVFYGLGWVVRRTERGTNWFHAGGLPGTATLMIRSYKGLAWAALFNSRPKDGSQFGRELDRTLWEAANQVTEWPEHDLFP